MQPAVICCCEVGTAMLPMTRDQMSEMAQTMTEAWELAATEHPEISALFEDDAPYLTLWDANLCRCTHGRILQDVYDVTGHRRTAQAFLCTMPGDTDEDGIDVVNVHAPSGTTKLTDCQRLQLIERLLQSSSSTNANKPIREGRFLVGGDMNATSLTLSGILNKLHVSNVEIMFPMNAKHGDICLVGGFKATMLRRIAINHDSQHVPYGIAWRKPAKCTTPPPETTEPRTTVQTEVAATGHASTPDTTTESRATVQTEVTATEHATEQSHPQTQIATTPDTTTESRATVQTEVAATEHTTEQSQPETQIATTPDTTTESRTTVQPEVAATGHATEQSHPQTQIATTPDTTTESRTTVKTEVAATEHGTEQSHPDEHEVPELNEMGQTMAYNIVNAFLDNVTFRSSEAERLIKEVILRKGEIIPQHMHNSMDEVFLPIFINYPGGLRDRTRAEPRDTHKYIKEWREIATWRHRAGAGVTPHATEQLAKHQRSKILHDYINNFIQNEATDTQKAESWTKNKSRAEAMLRNRCGSVLMAKAIWQIGLPHIPDISSATEQQRHSIPTATETILRWLSMLANSIQDHKATPAYQEHARKSGTQKNTSGLTEIELKKKEEKRHANRQWQQWQSNGRVTHGDNARNAPWRQGHRGDNGREWQSNAWRQWQSDTWQRHQQWQ